MTLEIVTPKRKPNYCSFCGKADHEVDSLIAGPTVFACNECIDLLHGMIHEPPRTGLSLKEQLEAHRAEKARST